MRITFVKPNIGRREHSLYVDEGRMEPLQLGVLAGLTPPDVECELFDDRMEAIPLDRPTDLVAITVEIYTARRAYELAAEYRRRGVYVVLGGFHPTLHPEEALAHGDAIVTGDAEAVWAGLVEDARRGELRERYDGGLGVPQHGPGGPMLPRRDLFRGKGYLPVTLAQYNRGCRFTCDFCAISVFFERRAIPRPIADVVRELRKQQRKFVFFVDDNLLSDHAHAKEFLRALIPLKIRWVSQASLDMTNDPELMELLVESGCVGNVIGFESLDPANLRSMRKAPNLTPGRRGPARDRPRDDAEQWDTYEQQVEVLRDHHLQTWAAFTLGHDHDTLESIDATLQFAMRNKFCFAAFNILMPYPNTAFYQRLEREGRLLWDGQWWLHPEYRFNHAAFQPRNMSPEELTEACFRCRSIWNRPRSVFRRMWDRKTHLSSLYRLGVYWAYNPLYAKEALKKQGMLFGLFRDGIRPRSAVPEHAPTN